MRQLTAPLALLLLLAPPLHAQESAELPPELPPELIPPEAQSAPSVTIRRDGENRIEEYRFHGQVYMVKITPSHGVPYYLIDSDGDGELETRRNDLANPPVVQWKLFSW